MIDIFDILKGKPEDSDYMKKGVIVQGITGTYGSIHARSMIADGTNIVAGVTPDRGGQERLLDHRARRGGPDLGRRRHGSRFGHHTCLAMSS